MPTNVWIITSHDKYDPEQYTHDEIFASIEAVEYHLNTVLADRGYFRSHPKERIANIVDYENLKGDGLWATLVEVHTQTHAMESEDDA